MNDKDLADEVVGDEVSFTREGVWRGKPFKISFTGSNEMPRELNEFLSSSDGGSLVLISKSALKKLLEDDAHQKLQVGDLQQRGTELVEQLRAHRRVPLTASQKEMLEQDLKATKDRLVNAYGKLAVGDD